MNYHHIYHAGNFADVFKHITLALCLEKFHEKPTPFFVLDTHAGIGKYNLSDEKSLKTFEADEGIKKLLKEKNFTDFLPERYLRILAKNNHCEIDELPEKLNIYAGSPIIIKDYLRRDDRAIFAELNREDYVQLKKNFAGNPKFSFSNDDGFGFLKSKLPPLEKRGLIIIDPAFEKDQSKVSADYKKIIEGLEDACKRFAHGVYLVWYPIIKSDKEVLEKFYGEMKKLKFSKILHATFDIGAKADETKMHACGMFIINAPWQLEEKLNAIMPKVLKVLKRGDGADFKIAP
jgi:23S rRNA (adenine2030-N6)-methyltransferase